MAGNEIDLLRRFRESASRESLRDLLIAHQDRIYNACFQVLGRLEDAEDAAQEALLKFAEGARTARDADAFRGWTYRVAFRVALDHWRRREAIRHRESRAAMNRPVPPPLDDRERLALFEAMDGLDDRERSLLLEHYFEKVPLATLGERRGLSAVAVWKRIDRAREKLKRTLLGAGFTVVTSRVSEALEVTAPAYAPATLVGESILSKILAGGFAVGATKSSTVPVVAVTVALLFVLAGGGVVLKRSSRVEPKPGDATAVRVASPTGPAEVTPTMQVPSSVEVSPTLLESPLRLTLKRYREWFFKYKELLTTPIPSEDPYRNIKARKEGWKQFKNARPEILGEPQVFLEFIRDPANADLVEFVIGDMLSKMEDHGGIGTARSAQEFGDFPVEFMEELVKLVKADSEPLKKAILDFLGSVHEVPESYDDLYEELMFDPDPRVQYLAVFARWRLRELPIPTLEKLLARYQTSTDRNVQQTVLNAISYCPKPETFRWMLDALEANQNPQVRSHLASTTASMTSKMNPDAESMERLVRSLIEVVQNTKAEQEQEYLLWSVLYLPVKESTQVLKASLPSAASARIKSAIESTLTKAALGTSTWTELQNHYWQQAKRN